MHALNCMAMPQRIDPVVVSDAIQTFKGREYRLNERGYYANRSGTIYRAVWAHHFPGPLEGRDVHHKNENKGDNCIDNLVALTRKEHDNEHRAGINAAMRASRATFKCEQCGKDADRTKRGMNKYCSNACNQKAWLARKTNHESRTCETCGNGYTAKRVLKTKYCSRPCYHVSLRK